MRLRGIDQLTLLLAVLVALLLWLRQLDKPGPRPLTTLPAAQVQEIRVFGQGELRLALLRDAEGWMLTLPEIARARPSRVANLLALLRAPSHGDWPASPGLLKQAGLEQPQRALWFDQLHIRFGGPSTPPGYRYVQVGDRVHLIDDFWFDLAGLPASHFREAE